MADRGRAWRWTNPVRRERECGTRHSSVTAMPMPVGRRGCTVGWRLTACRHGWSARRAPDGPIGQRLGTIFRDRDELPTSGNLGSTIRAALAESAALIVVCSPAAAQSRWVHSEIEAFQALGRSDRIASFIVDGEPGRTTAEAACFPPR